MTSTVLLSDAGNIELLSVMPDGRLVFSNKDAVHGTELWYSDGTAETTQLWMDINPGADDSYLSRLQLDGNSFYFEATSPAFGREVWYVRDMGSQPQVIDIAPGPASSNPTQFASSDGVFVRTDLGIRELNGSEATPLGDGGFAYNVYPLPMLGDNGGLYFYGSDLSYWDGNSIIHGRSFSLFGTFLGSVSNGVIFIADDGVTGMEIWFSDGTIGGTALVLDAETATASSSPADLLNHNGNLAFTASNTSGRMILEINGAGTISVVNSAILSGAIERRQDKGKVLSIPNLNGMVQPHRPVFSNGTVRRNRSLRRFPTVSIRFFQHLPRTD
ncbi:MAG: hypothetical protein WKF77_23860 [Planctomycetaceae bacterium]